MKKLSYILCVLAGMVLGMVLFGNGLRVADADSIQSFFKIDYGQQSGGYNIVRARVDLQSHRTSTYRVYKTKVIDDGRAWVYCRKK